VLVALPTAIATSLVLGLVLSANAKLEALANAAELSQKLASADATELTDAPSIAQWAPSFYFGSLITRTVTKDSKSVSVCLDYNHALGELHTCWHSFSEPG
jgi:hypothetical protein